MNFVILVKKYSNLVKKTSTNMNNLVKFVPENEIPFQGPFDKPTMSTLKMISYDKRLVAFKIKTTAPKYYCVVPTHGYIASNSEAIIYITYKGNEEDIKNAKIKHKFLVQTTYGPVDDTSILPDRYWKELNKEAKIFECKFQCLFDKKLPGLGAQTPGEKSPLKLRPLIPDDAPRSDIDEGEKHGQFRSMVCGTQSIQLGETAIFSLKNMSIAIGFSGIIFLFGLIAGAINIHLNNSKDPTCQCSNFITYLLCTTSVIGLTIIGYYFHFVNSK